jgi:hypothetical protein
MNLRARNDRNDFCAAFNSLELYVIIAVLGFLVVEFLAAGASRPARCKCTKINCVNNLKQVALAMQIWAGDNSDFYPAQVSTNLHGTKEFFGGENMFRHFQVMSNELNTPKVLICPADHRTAASNFLNDFSNDHLSYFLGADCQESHPYMLLSGDRNLTNGRPPVNGTMELTQGQPVQWTRGLHSFGTSERFFKVFNKQVYGGNIATVDDSVFQFTSLQLRQFLTNSHIASNRLFLP